MLSEMAVAAVSSSPRFRTARSLMGSILALSSEQPLNRPRIPASAMAIMASDIAGADSCRSGLGFVAVEQIHRRPGIDIID